MKKLQAYLQQLIDQPFLSLRVSYGDELSLHFGQPRSYSSQRLKHLVKGSYILGSRASTWYLQTPHGEVSKDPEDQGFQLIKDSGVQKLSKEELEETELLDPNAKVVGVHVILIQRTQVDGSQNVSSADSLVALGTANLIPARQPRGQPYYGLLLMLSDGSNVEIIPESAKNLNAKEDAVEIADWEVFTPYARYLRVGPGEWWSYWPSRQPTSSGSTSAC